MQVPYPFRVRVLPSFIGCLNVLPIEAADCQGQNKAGQVEDRKQHEAERKVTNTHDDDVDQAAHGLYWYDEAIFGSRWLRMRRRRKGKNRGAWSDSIWKTL